MDMLVVTAKIRESTTQRIKEHPQFLFFVTAVLLNYLKLIGYCAHSVSCS